MLGDNVNVMLGSISTHSVLRLDYRHNRGIVRAPETQDYLMSFRVEVGPETESE